MNTDKLREEILELRNGNVSVYFFRGCVYCIRNVGSDYHKLFATPLFNLDQGRGRVSPKMLNGTWI